MRYGARDKIGEKLLYPALKLVQQPTCILGECWMPASCFIHACSKSLNASQKLSWWSLLIYFLVGGESWTDTGGSGPPGLILTVIFSTGCNSCTEFVDDFSLVSVGSVSLWLSILRCWLSSADSTFIPGRWGLPI